MKSINRYSHRHFKSLIRHLCQYAKKTDAETLHEVRVDIKKLKALFHLANARLKQFHMQKEFQPLRLIFQQAGKIRLSDVKQRIEKNKAERHDGPAVTRQRQAFQRATPRRVAHVKSLEKEVSKKFDMISKKDLNDYWKATKSDVKGLLYPKFLLADLHPARKKIKDIVYLSPIRGRKEPDPFYDKLQELIGKWHDKQSLLATLHAPQDRKETTILKAKSRADLATIRKLITRFYGERK